MTHPPLQLETLDELAEGQLQIIVVLIDALSLERFRSWMEEPSLGLKSFWQDGSLFQITSVVPSTTSTALTTLWTGRSPAEHGILGYELFLKEYGLIANMITHSPASFEGRSGMLHYAGFEPEAELPVPTLGPHLANAGVETFSFLSRAIHNSGLSRMHYANVDSYGFRTVTDLWILVRRIAELRFKSPRFLWIYYGAIDALSHQYGPDAEQVKTEFATFIRTMLDSFVMQLDPDARRNTLLILLSDHGQVFTPREAKYELNQHPNLTGLLHMAPTGESRFSYLYPKSGSEDSVKEYFNRTWNEDFRIIHSSKALESGLFGPGEPAKVTADRIGELIAISQGSAFLWGSPYPNPLLGRHGGLSPDEMVIPLFAFPMG